jgi:pimeloyl-ACP methyl ester carboxylesterase
MLVAPLLAVTGAATAQHLGVGTKGRNPWSATYTARKGTTPLALYRRRAVAREGVANGRPVILLAHGSSFGALASYDLSVRSEAEYSLMNILARGGFDVWAIDFDGYARSGSSGGNSDIASGVEDLRAAVSVIERETGQRRLHLYGQSSGAIRIGAYAMAEPERAGHLILESFSWTGEGSPTLAARRRNIQTLRASPRRRRDRDSIASIFTRDHPEATDPEVVEAMLAAELPFGNSVPSGSYIDMAVNLPLVDPARLASPVMMIRGQYDGNSTDAELMSFFAKLPNANRQYISIAGAAHGIILGRMRGLLHRSLLAFLPPPNAVATGE